jgi:hypothetical protein
MVELASGIHEVPEVLHVQEEVSQDGEEGL